MPKTTSKEIQHIAGAYIELEEAVREFMTRDGGKRGYGTDRIQAALDTLDRLRQPPY